MTHLLPELILSSMLSWKRLLLKIIDRKPSEMFSASIKPGFI
jgi:hypothetical protein